MFDPHSPSPATTNLPPLPLPLPLPLPTYHHQPVRSSKHGKQRNVANCLKNGPACRNSNRRPTKRNARNKRCPAVFLSVFIQWFFFFVFVIIIFVICCCCCSNFFVFIIYFYLFIFYPPHPISISFHMSSPGTSSFRVEFRDIS
jgi:hypothetical protein